MNVMEETLHLEPEQFDLLVSEVMDELPQAWAPLLDNMAVVVEDEPAEDDRPAGSPADTLLLGRYRDTAPVQLIGGGLTGPAMAAHPRSPSSRDPWNAPAPAWTTSAGWCATPSSSRSAATWATQRSPPTRARMRIVANGDADYDAAAR